MTIRHKKNSKNKGFTLIELLVVISIIGLMASIALVSLNSSRIKGRDARRLSDMRQIQTALEMYSDTNGRYPDSDYAGCGGWDTPGNNTFINILKTSSLIASDPKDPKADDSCSNYRYYRYNAGDYSCDVTKGAYYVLGIVDMEGSGNPHPQSPGWSCSGRNWQGEMEWVRGGFEK